MMAQRSLEYPFHFFGLGGIDQKAMVTSEFSAIMHMALGRHPTKVSFRQRFWQREARWVLCKKKHRPWMPVGV